MPVMPRMKSCVDDRVHVKSTCWLVSMPVEKPLALCGLVPEKDCMEESVMQES